VLRNFFVKLVLLAAIVAVSLPALAANTVTAARVWPAQDYTRLALESNEPFKYQLLILKHPDRIVLDIEDLAINDVLRTLSSRVAADDPYIAQMRTSQFQENVVRVVVDLKAEVKSNVFALKPAGEYQHRLVLDIYPLQDPVMALLDSLEKEGEQPPPQPLPEKQATGESKPQSKPERKRVVTIAIDAGHGGEDPGAIGPKGSREKHVTLAIAKILKKKIDAEPNMRGVLIRDGDYFVPLGRRVTKARKLKADLFISIHADAFDKPSAHGSSVYALSEKGATSATARFLAKKENASDLIGGVSLKDKEPILAKTLISMQRDVMIKDSISLGQLVLGNIKRINKLHKRNVEQANFAVLKAPDIPSILVETAFISNPAEERKLTSWAHQNKLANSILTGVKKYFSSNPALAKY